MKIMWTGSDTLFSTRLLGGRKFPTKLLKYPYFLAMTVFAKVADFMCEGHYVVAEHLKENLKPLKLKKPINVLIDPPKYPQKFEKIPHKGFNILYYRGVGGNQAFKDWVYGYDVMQVVVADMVKVHDFLWVHDSVFGDESVNLIEVNGNAKMEEIYPFVDAMVRCNRSDGEPRMVMECKNNNIPYYWSKENPVAENIINFINNEIQRKAQG